MKTIVLASENPVKIRAVRHGFQRMFPGETFVLQSVSVPSLVSPQPCSDAETLQGALNRVRGASQLAPQADFWVGVEGGVEDLGQEMTAFAWVAILGNGRAGKGRTGTFFLPAPIAELVRQGKELGEADDIVFSQANSKQRDGAIGLLTGNVIDRAALYEHAVILALLPFKNVDLYLPLGRL
ncbi:MAG: inosine/xanthosine triphosphatase [Anaerolineales bacterium]|nr:inosine/xanthosine triphosphatase [Anaerolineales bacterium]